ncbi:MAG: hypothetical protein HY040_23020 [Planctomycetes bacterium]|nr:hypothetical protein [Planctomycetota bacterium]
MARALVPGMAVFGLLLAAGCQGKPAPLVRVSGKVSYKDVPLPGGTIAFAPDVGQGGSGPIAHGKILVDGSFQLLTGETQGAAPGFYRVTVTSLAAGGGQASGERFVIPPSLIPERYRDPELSHLTCEIKAGRSNTINFNLD